MRRIDRLLEAARREADNEDYGVSEGIAQDVLVEYINEAQDKIQRLVSSAYAEFLQTEYTFNTVVGQEEYTIQNSRLFLQNRVSLVEFSSTGQAKDFRPLRKATIFNKDETQGQPTRYIRRNNRILLNPIPQSATYSVRVSFEREANDLDIRRGRIFSMTGPFAETFTIQLMTTAGVTEQTRVQIVSVPAENTYFFISSPMRDFYCWFNKGTGTDPNIAGRVGVELDISAAATAAAVKTVCQNTIGALDEFTTTTVSSTIFQFRPVLVGNTTDWSQETADPYINQNVLNQGSGGPAFLTRFDNGDYFTIDSPTNAYYVWLNIGGDGTDPAVSGKIGIEVALSYADTNITAGTKIAAAINAEADFTASSASGTITVTCTETGVATDPTRGNMKEASTTSVNPALTITVTQQGTQIDVINLEDTLPVPDPELDNLDIGDCISIVDKDGTVKVNCIPVSSGSSTLGSALINAEYTLAANELPAKGDYVVFGKYTSTHSELPDNFEAYLRKYTVWKILEKDGSTDISRKYERQLFNEEEELVNAYSSLGEELIEIPLLGTDFDEEFL